MTRLRRRVALVAIAALAAASSACGVRTQSSPSTIARDDVPFGLVEPEPATPASERVGPGAARVTIYLVRADGLVPVEREVSRPPGPQKVLRVLGDGPTAEELADGVLSALDVDAAPPTARRDGRRILVELHEGFFTEGGPQILALAQIVYSLTALEPEARVQFLLDGAPAEVPRGDGVLTSRPVDRTDYEGVAPVPVAPPT